ncbi:MAG: electron transport complex subunit RsxE [Acetobacteraceae bacterium]|nr:electron transport complex subunit RsxE [Acetobacteraceae bacterium]
MAHPGRDLLKGLILENPVFGLVLGLCPTLAVTTGLSEGFWMGVAVVFVLTLSNGLISALRRFIPDHVRIPAFIVIIATFVTVADLALHAVLPGVYRVLGLFVPLIVVNCIILGRAEAFASKSPLRRSLADGLGMGLGFMGALIAISAVRELLGTGNLAVGGLRLLGEGPAFPPALVMALPPGAFFTIGALLALFRWARGAARGGVRRRRS